MTDDEESTKGRQTIKRDEWRKDDGRYTKEGRREGGEDDQF
jgi:hypothetical protein